MWESGIPPFVLTLRTRKRTDISVAVCADEGNSIINGFSKQREDFGPGKEVIESKNIPNSPATKLRLAFLSRWNLSEHQLLAGNLSLID